MPRSRAIFLMFLTGVFCLMISPASSAVSQAELDQQLIEAVRKNDLDAVQVSVGEGADPSATNNRGLSAIDIAVDRGVFEIAHYLLAAKNRKHRNAAPSTPAPQALSGVPVAAPTVSVEKQPLSANPDVLIPKNPTAVRRKPISIPPVERELVAEEPEPILVLPVIPSSTQASEPTVPQAKMAEKTLQEAPSAIEVPDEDASFLDKITGVFSGDEAPRTAEKPIPAPTVPDPTSEPEPEQQVSASDNKTEGPGSAERNVINPPETQPVDPVELAETTDPEEGEDGSLFSRIGDFFSSSADKKSASQTSVPSTALDELETLDPVAAETPLPAQTPDPSTPAPEPVKRAESQTASNSASLPKKQSQAPVAIRPNNVPNEPAGRVVTTPDRSLVNQPRERLQPENTVNPFTRLTDFILDILPDGEETTASDATPSEKEKAQGAEAPARVSDDLNNEPTESATPEVSLAQSPAASPNPEVNVAFPVADLTKDEDPYKVTPTPKPSLPTKPKSTSSAEVEQAQTVSVEPQPVPQIALAQADPIALVSSDISFGDRGQIGTPLSQTQLVQQNCIEKAAWDSHFCLETFDWPPALRNAFYTSSFLKGSGQSIVHYKNHRSVQYHGLFPSGFFKQIATYLISIYGAPTEKPEIWTALLAEAKKRNTTLRWEAKANDGGPDIVLEIREIDDLRWSAPPDKRNGVIRMYRKGDNEIFRLLTTADLLLLQVRKGSDLPSPPPAKAN